MKIIQFDEILHSNQIVINGLDKYIGKKLQVTIIVEDKQEKFNKPNNKFDKALEIIKGNSCNIEKWKREELYDR